MNVRRTILGTVLIAGLSATNAFAGGELYPVTEAPEVAVVAAQGWYIRGDLGYSGWIDGDGPRYHYYDINGDLQSNGVGDMDFDDSFSYGVGMGYQFNNYFRADLTADFFNSSVDGESQIGSNCPVGGASCDLSHETGFDAISIMANGYVDLGTYAGFTPYVGAGIGSTNIQWDDARTVTCDATSCDTTTNPGEESWRFTYALMAGASYDLTNRIKLDVGYRYSDVDGGKMFGYNSAERARGASGTDADDDGFQRHEIRAGVRVTTW